MYAVVETGGRQYKIKPGQTVQVNLLPVNPGDIFTLEKVLFISNDDKIEVGSPYLSGCQIQTEVIGHGRCKKIRIIKQRRRKHYMKRMGHRQDFTKLKITQIVTEAL